MEVNNNKVDLDALWEKSLVRVTDEFALPPVILQVDDAISARWAISAHPPEKQKPRRPLMFQQLWHRL